MWYGLGSRNKRLPPIGGGGFNDHMYTMCQFCQVGECTCSSCLLVNFILVDTQLELQALQWHLQYDHFAIIFFRRVPERINLHILYFCNLGNNVSLTYKNLVSMHKLLFHCKIVS